MIPQAPILDLVQHLYRQREFSLKTFGPGPRTEGVCDHIRKELAEIAAEPGDLYEWVDLKQRLVWLCAAYLLNALPDKKMALTSQTNRALYPRANTSLRYKTLRVWRIWTGLYGAFW